MLGQAFTLPFTRMLPFFGCTLQERATATGVGAVPVTLNDAAPLQVAAPSTLVALSVIVKPEPSGRPPI